MSLAIIYSRASAGLHAPLITIEVHLAKGLPRFFMVGLPETAVKESRDRIRSAFVNSCFELPRGRMTINLAPADLPKEGGRFDLPIALGMLAASGQIPKERLAEFEFVGELALSGELRSVRGVLPIVLSAAAAGRSLIVPSCNAKEAALVKQATAYSASHLLEVCAYLKGKTVLPRCELSTDVCAAQTSLDLSDVRGQAFAKRALEVAASGKHSLLLIGPPGTGKTMLAARLPSIMPPLSDQQALEVASVASVSHAGFDQSKWGLLPLRAPHHTASSVALVGGGRPPRPGEISLAHQGVLFLDELPEFSRHVLESLREPLESGSITISRAAFQTVFPANFQLIAAMNPCPCGYAGSTSSACQCTEEQVQRYITKLSGPLMDRIDMQVEVPTLPPEVLVSNATNTLETSAVVMTRVMAARQQQFKRQAKCNAELSIKELEYHCQLSDDSIQLMNQVMHRFNLSARVYHRIVKVARTLADMDGSDAILNQHVSEALGYRCLDRNS